MENSIKPLRCEEVKKMKTKLSEKEISNLNGLRRKGTSQAVLHLQLDENGKVFGYLEATGHHSHNIDYEHIECSDRFSSRDDIRCAEKNLHLNQSLENLREEMKDVENGVDLLYELEEAFWEFSEEFYEYIYAEITAQNFMEHLKRWWESKRFCTQNYKAIKHI